jgi:GTP-binding protein Era
MRFGTVAIVGRSNVGKSTFLNHVLGEDLAIVSPLPQTTRDPLLGVVNLPEAQIAFMDTPGLHRPKSELGRRMNSSAIEAARDTDALLFMTDVSPLTSGKKPKSHIPGSSLIDEEDLELLEQLSHVKVPTVLVVNKVDLVRSKQKMLPYLTAFNDVRDFSAIIPASVLGADGVDRILGELEKLMPEGKPGFEADVITDRPTSFFAREYIREQILLALRGEVPHAVAVSIDKFEEGQKASRIAATIHVEKIGQRKILVGTGGAVIKEIRLGAQARLRELMGHRVYLELFVRVTPSWKSIPRQLAELGYEPPAGARKASKVSRRGSASRATSRTPK